VDAADVGLPPEGWPGRVAGDLKVERNGERITVRGRIRSAAWLECVRCLRGYEMSLDVPLEVFAEHDSPSVQASIWIIGRAILERHPEVAEVSMALPNLHHWLMDLAPFGLDNPALVFVSTREPHGLIEATVRRR